MSTCLLLNGGRLAIINRVRACVDEAADTVSLGGGASIIMCMQCQLLCSTSTALGIYIRLT